MALVVLNKRNLNIPKSHRTLPNHVVPFICMCEPNICLTQVAGKDSTRNHMTFDQEISDNVPNNSEVKNITREGIKCDDGQVLICC
jgi:hypothetical protein